MVSGLSIASSAGANDASYGGDGSVLFPLKETRVRMVSEDITMTLGDAWTIDAHYVFSNPTDNDIELRMGFPEGYCPKGDPCHGKGGAFRDLKTLVDGKEVEQTIGKAPPGHMLAERLGRVFVYNARFPAGKRVRIEHRYTYDRSPGNGEEFVSYITETGKLWNGPIEHARFTIKVPHKPWAWQIYGGPFEIALHDDRLILEATNWTPARNLTIAMEYIANAYAAHLGLEEQCKLPWAIAGEVIQGVPDRKELAALDAATLRKCRLAVIAHRGGPVPDDLRALYYPAAKQQDNAVRIWALPNPKFSDALLRGDEEKYVALCDELLSPPPRAPASSAPVSSAQTPPQQPKGCGGCAASPSPDGRWKLGLLLLIAACGRRARSRVAASSHQKPTLSSRSPVIGSTSIASGNRASVKPPPLTGPASPLSSTA